MAAVTVWVEFLKSYQRRKSIDLDEMHDTSSNGNSSSIGSSNGYSSSIGSSNDIATAEIELKNNDQGKPSSIGDKSILCRTGCFSFHLVPQLLTWIVCMIFFGCFLYHNFLEFTEGNAISVTSYRNLEERDRSIAFKICNNEVFDVNKLLYYREDNSTLENMTSFERMRALVSPHSPVQFYHPRKIHFLASQEKYQQLKLDMSQFVVGCEISLGGRTNDCVDTFQWQVESTASCYRADLTVPISSIDTYVQIDFYFDPTQKLSALISNSGAFVVTHHSEEYASPFTGVFLAPGQEVSASAQIVEQIQRKSFKKSNCVHKYGLQAYNFTGVPFEALYSVESCNELCEAETQYKKCNCSVLVGFNITNTGCLNEPTKTSCLKQVVNNPSNKRLDSCKWRCADKCNKKIIKTRYTNILQNIPVFSVYHSLLKFINYNSNDTALARRILNEILETNFDMDHPNHSKVETVSQYYSRYVFQLDYNHPVTVIEIIPLISTSTFVSNFGGLLGMWLGLSALSILEFIQSCFRMLCLRKHVGSAQTNNWWTKKTESILLKLKNNSVCQLIIFDCMCPESKFFPKFFYDKGSQADEKKESAQ